MLRHHEPIELAGICVHIRYGHVQLLPQAVPVQHELFVNITCGNVFEIVRSFNNRLVVHVGDRFLDWSHKASTHVKNTLAQLNFAADSRI